MFMSFFLVRKEIGDAELKDNVNINGTATCTNGTAGSLLLPNGHLSKPESCR